MAAQAFLAFSLGPVQSFIRAARTVRDLWTGSYLLAWLTYQGMKPLLDAHGEKAVVFPDVSEHPVRLWEEQRLPENRRLSLLQPCLPNRFLAQLPAEGAWGLAEKCEEACRAAWLEVCEAVRQKLHAQHPDRTLEGGNTLWGRQVSSFFEVRTAVLPWAECTGDRLAHLLERKELSTAGEESLWFPRWQVAGKLLQARRSVRYFPEYSPDYRPADKVAQKCTLLGTYEHLGPADRGKAQTFWEQAADLWDQGGTRTGRRERLCAISLVKRFAWPLFFSPLFRIKLKALRFADTATVAAVRWLKGLPALNPEEVREEHRLWSGQWLHWTNQQQDKDEKKVPDEIWGMIQDKRHRQGRPPAYLAILMMDADNMGAHLMKGNSPARHRRISAALGRFALQIAPELVEKHDGDLIYAGGDDILALLPTEGALRCAGDLREAFQENWKKTFPGEQPATLSAGLAVVHNKEDLRFALEQARKAEKDAKSSGRDALQVAICRRSGEHSLALCPWDYVRSVDLWVQAFVVGASDRWAYHLKAEVDTLRKLEPKGMQAEIERQINRAEEGTRQALPPDATAGTFDHYRQAKKQNPDGSLAARFTSDGEALEHFVTLCQTASFLARGRDA